MADAAESRKRTKYEAISSTHIFQPIAILGKRVTQATGDDSDNFPTTETRHCCSASCVRENIAVEVDDPVVADFRR